MALETAVRGRAPLISPTDLDERLARGERIQIVDVRAAKDYAKSHLPGAVNIPLADLRRRVGELDPQVPTVTYCNKGVTGNAAQNVLLALGLAEVMNLSGGNSTYQTHTRQMQRATSLPSTIKPSHLPHMLFLCVHNAGKSQMAGALMRHLYGDRIVVTTAGTGPDDAVDDASARIVAELGASTAGEHPKAVTAAMLDAARPHHPHRPRRPAEPTRASGRPRRALADPRPGRRRHRGRRTDPQHPRPDRQPGARTRDRTDQLNALRVSPIGPLEEEVSAAPFAAVRSRLHAVAYLPHDSTVPTGVGARSCWIARSPSVFTEYQVCRPTRSRSRKPASNRAPR